MEEGLLTFVSVCGPPPPRKNLRISEPIFMNLVCICVYVMEPELISTVYFINPCHQSVCLHAYHHICSRQQLCRHVPLATKARNIRRIEGVVFCTVHVV
jgi:hypothetical protein